MTALGAEVLPATKRELKAVKRYFARLPRWAVLLLLLSLGAVAAGAVTVDGEAIGIAGLAGVVIALLRMLGSMRRPSGAQMDRWLDRDLERLEHRASEKCGLAAIKEGPTSPTVVLTGAHFGTPGAEFAIRAKRREPARFTPVGVTILNFRKHQIFAYQCALDRFTGNALAETTDEYFYQDVVSVSTKTETLTLEKRDLTRFGRRVLRAKMRGGKIQIPQSEIVALTTSGGTSIEVVVGVAADRFNQFVMGPGGNVRADVAETAVKGIRKMLREKKIPKKPETTDGLP